MAGLNLPGRIWAPAGRRRRGRLRWMHAGRDYDHYFARSTAIRRFAVFGPHNRLTKRLPSLA